MKLKTFTSLLLFVLFLTGVKAQTTETFEDEAGGATTFTSNGQGFTLTNKYKIYPYGGNLGYQGSNFFVDNVDNPGVNQVNSIKTTNGALFTLKSFWLYTSTNGGLNPSSSGSVTMKGKIAGVIQFTIVKTTGFNTSLGTDAGFKFIDFSTEGGANNSNTSIDEIEITHATSFNYVAIDNFIWAATTPAITTTGSLSAFTSCSGSVSAAQSFTVSGTSLTTSITVTAPTGFEVSTSSGSGYGGSVSLAPSSGTVSNTTIYVRLTSSASGTPSGNVACSSTGATTKNVAASGTVNAAPSVTGNPASQTLCSGTATTFTVSATGTSVTYQWRKNSSSLSNTGVYTGATTATLTISDVAGLSGSTFDCVVSGSCSPTATSSTATLTVNTAPSVTGNPASQTLCSGTATTFTVSATGTSVTYQWRKNSSSLSNTGVYTGATTATLSVSDVTGLGGSTFDCVVSGSCSPTATSSTATLTVNTAPSVTGNPASQTLCPGTATTFTVSATGTSLTYQWRKNSSSLSNTGVYTGATTATLTISDVAGLGGSTFDCIVSGTCPSPATSGTATLTVNSVPSITGSPANQTQCPGLSTTFTISATGTSLTYQWRRNSSNLSNTGVYTGATTATLNISDVTGLGGSTFDCVVSGTCSPTATSSTATLTVNSAPSVSASPSGSTICAGDNTSFVVSATGTSLTYQWQVDQGSGFSNVSNGAPYGGATTATLTVTGATSGLNGYIYRCVVSGTCLPSANSASATLTINSAPSISSSPASSTICAGSNTSFVVSATGASLTYQWQVDQGSGFTNVSNVIPYSGATTATLTVTSATSGLNGYVYRCMIGGTCSPSANSGSATLTINTAPSITGHPSNQTQCPGGAATFTVSATGTDLTYQWRKNSSNLSNTGVYSGVNTATLTISDVTGLGGNTFDCVVSGTCSPSETSNTATLNVNSAPSINTQPSNTTICQNGNAFFALDASGTTLTYQWQEDQGSGYSNLSNTSLYADVNTATLTISAASSAMNGYMYRCVVNGCSSNINSNNVALTVNTIPTVTNVIPASRCDAGTVSLGATASAGTLNWYAASSGGSSLGTGISYTTPTLTTTTTYYVDATNNSCTSSRSSVIATVNNLPIVIANASSLTLCAGGSVTLTGGGAAAYIWTGGISNGVGFVPTTTTTYTVTGTDANTCSNKATVTVDVNPAITNSMTVTTPVCGSNNGSVSTVPQGGTSPFFYIWNNAQTSAVVTGLTGLPTQTMIVTVTDSKGCTHKDTALVSCVLAVEENAANSNLDISPNPNNGKFTIELNGVPLSSGLYILEIYNGFGQKIYSGAFEENNLRGTTSKETVDVNVPSGIYFLKVRSERQSYTKKIIIAR